MFIAYVIVTVLAAAANIFSATLDFIRYKQVLINMAKAGVPESWVTMLGVLKGAGAETQASGWCLPQPTSRICVGGPCDESATPGQSTVSFTEEDDYCADGSAAAIAACRNRQIGLAIIAEVT